MTLVRILAAALLLGFFACCVSSAILQVLAWNRHLLPGQAPSIRGLWRPEAFLDPVGARQIRLARGLLLVGAVMYVSHIVVLGVAGTMAR